MKTLKPLKVPFGTAKGVALRGARYLQWEDAFEVDFVDGLTFLEPHATIRKSNKISPKAVVRSVELDNELKHGFFVHYDSGETAEVSLGVCPRAASDQVFWRRNGGESSRRETARGGQREARGEAREPGGSSQWDEPT